MLAAVSRVSAPWYISAGLDESQPSSWIFITAPVKHRLLPARRWTVLAQTHAGVGPPKPSHQVGMR